MLDEMIQIQQDLSGLRDGSLSDAVKELQHYTFNTADRVLFKKNDEGRFFYQDSDGNNVTREIKIGGITYQKMSPELHINVKRVFGRAIAFFSYNIYLSIEI